MGAEKLEVQLRVRWGRLLSVVDAAEYLGVSVNTFTTLGIRVRRMGRRVLYDRLDLDRYVDRMDEQPVEREDLAAAIADEERRFFEGRAARGRN
jgi:hypothetical protein